MRGLERTMDNYYYFFRSTYQLWPYSRFSQTANEEGNGFQGAILSLLNTPGAKEWHTSPQSTSLCNLSAQTRHNGQEARISSLPANQSVLG